MACQGGKTKTVKPYQIIHPAPFVRGHREVVRGIPMDYDAYNDNVVDRESYERGRLFGAIFQEPLKVGKKVTWEAQLMLSNAFNTRAII